LEDGGIYPPHIVGGARALEICELFSFNNDEMAESKDDVRSKRANANLIAAAPALLEALQALMTPEGHLLHSPEQPCTGECQEARAALTKAGGKA
jgi:hypothetical protein